MPLLTINFKLYQIFWCLFPYSIGVTSLSLVPYKSGPVKPAMAYETRSVQVSDITMFHASFCILNTNLMDIILAFFEVILYGKASFDWPNIRVISHSWFTLAVSLEPRKHRWVSFLRTGIGPELCPLKKSLETCCDQTWRAIPVFSTVYERSF